MIQNDKFLKQAKKIVGIRKTKLDEEDCRTAISRAYYSLYHITGNKLRKKYSLRLIHDITTIYNKKRIDKVKLNKLDNKYLTQFNLHKIYCISLQNLGHKSEAQKFKDFRFKRNDADYDLHKNFPIHYSRTIVNEIEKLAQYIDKL